MNDCESMVLIKAALVAKEVWMESFGDPSSPVA
jgi:hypothetical protein